MLEFSLYYPLKGWICGKILCKFRIPKIQFTKHMKLKKKEEQIVDTLILLRRGNKIPMGGVRDKLQSRD
jgi:hypothetical protein